MKNSLFKRVAAAAAAVPLALTQCLTFSSVAAENDAVQIVGNTVQDGTAQTVSLESLLYIPANKTESTWNVTGSAALAKMVGTKGSINNAKILDLVKYVPANYREAAKAALEDYVLVNPVTYEVTADKNIVLKATVSQPNFNGNWANTPGKALSDLAKAYNAPELNTVDFSSVKVGGDLVVTIKTSKLDEGTTVPVEVVYKTADGDIYAGDFAKFANDKLTELENIAKKAIENEVAAQYAKEATDKFLAKTALIRDKINKAEKALDQALTKQADYKSISEAADAANKFLAKKNINKKVPSSAAEVAAKETVKKYYDAAVKKASAKADIQITAEQLGAFVDSLTSKTLTDSEGNEFATAFDINLNNGKATLVGAFEDAEAADVQKWVESKGYAYVGSYKKLTGTVDFTGIKTADTASVDVQIERILVTETTTTTTTTTDDGSTTTTTTDDGSTTTTTTDDGSTTTTTTDDGSTTSTTSTTDDGSTTTTTTTTNTVTSAVKTQYVEIESVDGFYFNTEDKFDTAQIKKAVLHTVYNEGYTGDDGVAVVLREYESEPVDITAELTFGAATPANTYKAVENKFDYEIPVYYNNATLKDAEGNDATVTVYIGLKGDTDLNNIVDGRDATATLTYYAATSTDGKDATTVALSPSTLVGGNPESVYDDFAGFLSDVKVDAGKELTRFAKKAERLIDGRDASSILTFYTKSSVDQYKDMAANEPNKLWDIVTGDAEEE
ncbi:MAG: hypothetical protein BWZ04_01947 [Firmicutes bacterium ADurb.BinA205]|nr:MAG: hypothetical protein BWZ04_01947 [Firmicutes bacterium ADurb.BinA205]